MQAFWVGEAAVKTQSKIVLEQVTIKAFQLATLVPVTEELLEDAPALDGYLRRKVPEKIDFKVSMALVWGSGAGQPLGFMNSPGAGHPGGRGFADRRHHQRPESRQDAVAHAERARAPLRCG